MSNKRIDHAAEALAHLDDAEAYANDAHSCRVNGNDERSAQALSHAAISAQQAQVHAILAVAEQARIANLIALTALDSYDEIHRVALNALADVTPPENGKGWLCNGLNPDIAAALGLEVEG